MRIKDIKYISLYINKDKYSYYFNVDKFNYNSIYWKDKGEFGLRLCKNPNKIYKTYGVYFICG